MNKHEQSTQQAVDFFVAHMGSNPLRILEVGCGQGDVALLFGDDAGPSGS